MTDETDNATAQGQAGATTVAPVPIQIAGDQPAPAAFSASHEETAGADAEAGSDRPELIVAGAFAGGFVIAMILKRIAR